MQVAASGTEGYVVSTLIHSIPEARRLRQPAKVVAASSVSSEAFRAFVRSLLSDPDTAVVSERAGLRVSRNLARSWVRQGLIPPSCLESCQKTPRRLRRPVVRASRMSGVLGTRAPPPAECDSLRPELLRLGPLLGFSPRRLRQSLQLATPAHLRFWVTYLMRRVHVAGAVRP